MALKKVRATQTLVHGDKRYHDGQEFEMEAVDVKANVDAGLVVEVKEGKK